MESPPAAAAYFQRHEHEYLKGTDFKRDSAELAEELPAFKKRMLA
jgi:hypothetical protein